MRRRLEVLESENARSEAKVLELQDRLAQENAPNGHAPVINISEDPNSKFSSFAADSSSECSFTELAHSLQEEVAILQSQIEQHNSTLARLQAKPEHGGVFDASADASPSWQNAFTSLHEALAQLTDQVMHVRRTLEDILETLKPVSYVQAETLQGQADSDQSTGKSDEDTCRTSDAGRTSLFAPAW
jgi:uncharacterized protein YukE